MNLWDFLYCMWQQTLDNILGYSLTTVQELYYVNRNLQSFENKIWTGEKQAVLNLIIIFWEVCLYLWILKLRWWNFIEGNLIAWQPYTYNTYIIYMIKWSWPSCKCSNVCLFISFIIVPLDVILGSLIHIMPSFSLHVINWIWHYRWKKGLGMDLGCTLCGIFSSVLM